jgi:hypothetical protein
MREGMRKRARAWAEGECRSMRGVLWSCEAEVGGRKGKSRTNVGETRSFVAVRERRRSGSNKCEMRSVEGCRVSECCAQSNLSACGLAVCASGPCLDCRLDRRPWDALDLESNVERYDTLSHAKSIVAQHATNL